MAPKHTSDRTFSSAQTAGFQKLAELQNRNLGSIALMGTAWVEAISQMGSEVTQFVADRIKEDVKTQHKILHCKDMTELHNLQAEFLQTALEQYAAESGKLLEISNSLMTEALKDRQAQ